MRYFTVILSFIGLFLSERCFAQSDRFIHFKNYINSYQPPKTVLDVCTWQLAMVKVQTDKQSRIISYNLLNKTSDELKGIFRYLLGYKFSPELKLQNKPIVFCIVFENQKSDCFKERQITGTDALGIIYPAMRKQIITQPNTIFLDIMNITVSSDPIVN